MSERKIATLFKDEVEEWKSREEALAYFRGVVNNSDGEEKRGAFSIYLQLLEGSSVASDKFKDDPIEPYVIKVINDGRYYIGAIDGEPTIGEKEARMVFPTEYEAEVGAATLNAISDFSFEIEKDESFRVKDKEKYLAAVGVTSKTTYSFDR